MSHFDLRYAILLVINIVKSQTDNMPWDWDPFDIFNHFTWKVFWLSFSLFLFFSFISIRIPVTLTLTGPVQMGYVRMQFGDFSGILSFSFMASIILPQLVFWYVYPTIILLSSCSTWLKNVMFHSFVICARSIRPRVPNLNIFISPSYSDEENLESEGVDGAISGSNLEDGISSEV